MKNEDQEIWEAKAGFWDDYVGPEGNEFHRRLVSPASLKLLNLKGGETVVDIGCGNGQFTREMAQLGVTVEALDFAPTFIERARKHTREAGIRGINYRVMDATDENELRSLGNSRFDAAVATMVLMDVRDIKPLLRALRGILKPNGRFVFSICHPCFNHSGIRMVAEQSDDGELKTIHGVKIVSYLSGETGKGTGIRGEPEPHYYFDRPLSAYLNSCFDAGFVLDGIEETAFRFEKAKNPFSWSHYPEVPPVLVARMRSRKN